MDLRICCITSSFLAYSTFLWKRCLAAVTCDRYLHILKLIFHWTQEGVFVMCSGGGNLEKLFMSTKKNVILTVPFYNASYIQISIDLFFFLLSLYMIFSLFNFLYSSCFEINKYCFDCIEILKLIWFVQLGICIPNQLMQIGCYLYSYQDITKTTDDIFPLQFLLSNRESVKIEKKV